MIWLALVAVVLLVAYYYVSPVRHGPTLGWDWRPATLRERFAYLGLGFLAAFVMVWLFK